MRGWKWPFAIALVAGCASTPPPAITEGEEEFEMIAHEHVIERDPTSGTQLPGAAFSTVEGLLCTLSNDKGTWTVTTPGKVRLARSSRPLQVECRKEGYRTLKWSVRCVSPRQSAQEGSSHEAALLLAMAPLVAIAPPAALWLAPEAAGIGAQAAYGAGAGPRADLCSYGWALQQFWVVRNDGDVAAEPPVTSRRP